MLKVKISLNSIDKVKSFVNDISGFNAEFDLVSGRFQANRLKCTYRQEYRRHHGSIKALSC